MGTHLFGSPCITILVKALHCLNKNLNKICPSERVVKSRSERSSNQGKNSIGFFQLCSSERFLDTSACVMKVKQQLF